MAMAVTLFAALLLLDAAALLGTDFAAPDVVHRLLADGQVLGNVIPEFAAPERRDMLLIGVEQLDRRLSQRQNVRARVPAGDHFSG